MPDEERQESLFRPVDRETVAKQKRLMAAADKLNLWFGRGTVRPATMGTHQPWKMRQGRLSPRYTTRLSDLPPAHLQ